MRNAQLLDLLNNVIDIVTGRIARVHSMDGTRIEDIDQLFSNTSNGRSFVVCSADDPFYNIKYDVNSVKQKPILGLAGSTKQNEFLSMIRKPRKPGKIGGEDGGKPTTSHHSKKAHHGKGGEFSEAENDDPEHHEKNYHGIKKKKNKKATVQLLEPENSGAEATDAEAEARKQRAKSTRGTRSRLTSPNGLGNARPTTSNRNGNEEIEEDEALRGNNHDGDADENFEDKDVKFFNQKSPQSKSRARTAPKSRAGLKSGGDGDEEGIDGGLSGVEDGVLSGGEDDASGAVSPRKLKSPQQALSKTGSQGDLLPPLPATEGV
jgi:hypothetical protein